MINDESPDVGQAFFEDAILTQPGESLLATVQAARASKASQEFHSLVSWLRDHNGDVNHSAFVVACNKVAFLASSEAKIRHPICLQGLGYRTLDYAAALLRTYIPGDVMFHTLPGYFGEEEEPV